jgi:hydroxyacid-oxoacid transhydrogenase
MGCLDIPNETIFTMEMTPIKFGPGATDEVVYDLKRRGVKHTLIITDPGIVQLGLPDRVRTLIQEAGSSADVFDAAHGECLLRELRDKTRRQVDALRVSESTRIFWNHERKGEAHASKTHHRAIA